MNKRLVGIITAIIVVIALVAGIFFFMNKDTDNSNVDNTQNSSTSDKANELDKYIDGMGTEQIEDTLNKEPTDTQKDSFQYAIEEIAVPEIGSDIIIDDEGTAHYTDTAGNDVEVEVDQEIKNKTDEELEDDYEQMMQALKDYQTVGGNSNNTGNQNNSNNTSNNQQPTGNNTGSPSTGNIDYEDDISDEEAAEARRKAEEAFLNNGGTIITDQREGQISASEEEYIASQLRPAN